MDTKNSNWHPVLKISENLVILANDKGITTTYSLFYKHTFHFFSLKKLAESELFNIKYQNSTDIKTVAEKLRYYRHKNALLQKDIAKYLGINECTYINYESGKRDYYPIDALKKISELYKVDILEFMDDYNLFVYQEQGKKLKALIKELKLTKKYIAEKLSVHPKTVSAWENEKGIMPKEIYTKLFKDKIFG